MFLQLLFCAVIGVHGIKGEGDFFETCSQETLTEQEKCYSDAGSSIETKDPQDVIYFNLYPTKDACNINFVYENFPKCLINVYLKCYTEEYKDLFPTDEMAKKMTDYFCANSLSYDVTCAATIADSVKKCVASKLEGPNEGDTEYDEMKAYICGTQTHSVSCVEEIEGSEECQSTQDIFLELNKMSDLEGCKEEEIPIDDTPDFETPIEDTPPEDDPIEDTPPEDDPIEDTPPEGPEDETPIDDTPPEGPEDETPIDDTPPEGPEDETPIEDTPPEGPEDETPEDKPKDETPIVDQPDEGDSSVDQPDEGDSSVDQPDEGDSSVDQPDEGDTSVDQPDEGDTSVDQPDEGDTSVDKPKDEGDTSVDQPDEGDTSVDQSEDGATTMDQSENEATTMGQSESRQSTAPPMYLSVVLLMTISLMKLIF